MRQATPAIALQAMTIRLGSRTILENISLEIGAGEFVGVLGPNGAGKTTLMRALLHLLPTSAGDIRVFGMTPAAAAHAGSIGYMPQVRGGLDGFRISGRDFVACALDGTRWGLPSRGRAARLAVDAALETVGANALAARPISELSGGERQRLLLAQCLLGQPRLLLLDEPLISLDPHRQHQVIELVRDISRQLGITVLFSAHEINPLLGAIDRVLYLGGTRAALGSVDEVITAPVLSALYQAPIDVLKAQGRIFVMSGGEMIEKDTHHHHA